MVSRSCAHFVRDAFCKWWRRTNTQQVTCLMPCQNMPSIKQASRQSPLTNRQKFCSLPRSCNTGRNNHAEVFLKGVPYEKKPTQHKKLLKSVVRSVRRINLKERWLPSTVRHAMSKTPPVTLNCYSGTVFGFAGREVGDGAISENAKGCSSDVLTSSVTRHEISRQLFSCNYPEAHPGPLLCSEPNGLYLRQQHEC